jgi:hypothetical protein
MYSSRDWQYGWQELKDVAAMAERNWIHPKLFVGGG